MEKRSFETLLYSVTASVVAKIAEENQWQEDLAMERFIRSKVYALLEQYREKDIHVFHDRAQADIFLRQTFPDS